MTHKAVFFDRDATLILDKHYMHRVEDIEYFEDTFSSLKELQAKGFLIFMVTNQSGIGRGFFSEEAMHEVHKQMLLDFEEHNIKISDIAFCPHAPEQNCSCRKPKPQMLLLLAQKHQIDLSQSYMVGDKMSDVKCGENAGAKGLLIANDAYKNLTEMTNFILKKT